MLLVRVRGVLVRVRVLVGGLVRVRVRVRMSVAGLRERMSPRGVVPRGRRARSRSRNRRRRHTRRDRRSRAPEPSPKPAAAAGRRARKGVDLEAEADDLLAGLGEELALLALEPRLELIVCIVCDGARAGRRAGEEPVRAENEGSEGEGVAWVSL